MPNRIMAVVVGLAATCVATSGMAETAEEEKLRGATEVLQQMSEIPENKVPPSLLSKAYAVAVIPNVIKGAFLVGGRFGKGVLVVRDENGDWSNPSFIKLTGGSFGFQWGAQSVDIFLIFKNWRGVQKLTNGKMTLGADASVAAGPVGRQTSAATDIKFEAEVYSYSRTRGLFAGVALDGSVMQIDDSANTAFYKVGNITAEQIFSDAALVTPAAARQFVLTLASSAPNLADTTVVAGDSAAPEATELKTYPIGERVSVEEPEAND